MGYFNFKWCTPPMLPGGPTTAILIRARSVVQVHPGPPYIPSIYAAILTFAFLWSFQKVFLSTICQLPDRLNAGSSGSACNHCQRVHPPAARDSDRSTGHLYEWRIFQPSGLLLDCPSLKTLDWIGQINRIDYPQ